VAIVSTNNVMNDKVESSAGAAASASLTPNTILLADPTLEEMSIADSVITIGIMPNWKEVTLWEQWSGGGGDSGGDDVDTSNTSILGAVSLETTNEAVNLCRAGCRTMHKFLREHLIGACSNDGS
jgi:exosome complex component MTR3